ncbi:MAG: DUF3604 domain-containing protein, partial [Candidatus Acidiferrum sp.]
MGLVVGRTIGLEVTRMPRFDVTKFNVPIGELRYWRYRLVFSGILAITLAAVLGVIVRSEVRGADAKRQAENNPHIQAVPSSALPARVDRNPEREVYFGETHIHTSWSFDAYVFGNTKAGPEDAYKFAMGEAIDHPAGYKIKITRPLDFMAVTDHAEYAGTVPLANDPNSPISKLPIAEKLKVRSKEDIQRVYMFLGGSLLKNEPIQELISPEVAGSVWKQFVTIADKYYQPGKFTTFAAYEWTSTPDNRNMHRNIIFKDSKKVPDVPFTSLDSDHPEDLWNW